ncbi:glycerol kinase GlpK [Synechococcus sp. EJ6-Ellesmere]|uniref:FGGY family carbohydrate kinase n=1 Tax=Synechococcus sp. EJ6-Ellesmere TaxID=2823734 RepID=UPI0020CE1A00|nr:glycerol kinase GlpK [Synechococcus sp. EJ6-Ellesmere]MCP9824473.1 glycerol kinase GlpK [Synechococcus sp. EJ6-Ellesmere]
MLSPLLLSIDQGTTSSRAAVYDLEGHRLLSRSAPLESRYPADGWVEQSAGAIWLSQLQALRELEQALSPEQRRAVAACGIANQRETTVLWRRGSGEPLAPVIVWQDGRTAALCAEWKQAGLEPLIRARTGLLVDPYFSASKIVWLLREIPAAAAAAAAGQLCFGTVDSWLLQNLSASGRHASECSNASRTLLMDLEQLRWDPELCAALGVPPSALPELLPSCAAFGTIAPGLPFAGVPITAMLGDQQAATLGQGCLTAGEGKCTYGTGAFLVINTGPTIHRSSAGLLSTVGWSDAAGRPTYCLEGSLFNAGTAIQWLRDGLGLIERSEQVNELAARCDNSGGVMLVPAFTGWGTPHWDPSARGLLIGLTRDSGPAQIARAALEGIALAVATLVQLAEEARGQPLLELAADGGAAASGLLLQAQADATGLPVLRRADLESTSRGVALLAGVQAGVLPDLASWSRLVGEPAPERFSPRIDGPSRQRWRARWHSAVERSLHWHSQPASVGAAESER